LASILTCVPTALAQSPPPTTAKGTPATPSSLPLQIISQSQPLPEGTQAVRQAPLTTAKHALPEESLTPIHPQRIDLQWQDDCWQLVDDGIAIKDFGRREKEARTALSLIREFGFTERGTIGSPQPVMEYWLVNGHAPSGAPRSMRPKPIDLATLRVEETQKQWVVRDVYQMLFNFGDREQDARQAAAVLRRYGFTQIGSLGQGTPVMLVLFGNPEQTASEQPSQHTPRMSSRVPFSPAESPSASGTGVAKEQEIKEPNPFPVLQRVSPLRPHDSDKKEGNHDATPSIASLPQGRQLSPPRQLMPDMDAPVERVPFDWRQLQTRKEGEDWQLRVGPFALARFGTDRAAADKALKVLQFYHCTEQCLVGGPQALVSYCLTDGQAPRGRMLGLETTAFRCDALKIQQAGMAWSITDGDHVLFMFDRAESAKQVLQAIQKHKFDHLSRIGQGETPAMTFLLRMN
jgi:hypothetical protein